MSRRYDQSAWSCYAPFPTVTPLGTSLAERLARALAPKFICDVKDNVMAYVA
jgi:hypothetical protein